LTPLTSRLVRLGIPALTVRRFMHSFCCLGCAASVLPLALNPAPSLALAVTCLTLMLSCYGTSYGGFHSYLQQVATDSAGVLQGMTNSCSVFMGILGTTAAGLALEATGSYRWAWELLSIRSWFEGIRRDL